MLKIKPIKLTKNQIKEIKVADAIIFSSANAVNISRNYLNSFSNKVFCVGDDTKVACLKNNIKKFLNIFFQKKFLYKPIAIKENYLIFLYYLF